MRKKDYTKTFNFFEYEQTLNNKNSTKEELNSLEELALSETSFSVINTPEITPKQSETTDFRSVFDVETATKNKPLDVFDKNALKEFESFNEIADEFVSKEIIEDNLKQETDTFDDIKTENSTTDSFNTPDTIAFDAADDVDTLDNQQFDFAVETVTPTASAPAPTFKVKKSFLKTFKKQKITQKDEPTEEFFVEPVVSDIDKEQLTLNLDFSQENEPNLPVENAQQEFNSDTLNDQSGQQFFAEAILDEISSSPKTPEEIPSVNDNLDSLFEEPVQENQEEVLDNANTVINTQDSTFETLDEQPFNKDDQEQNPYNFVLDDEDSFKQESNLSFEQEDNKEVKQNETLSNLLTYKELKLNAPKQFETPYLFKGKKAEHIRFRLSLGEEHVAKKARTIQLAKEYIILIISAFLIGLFLNFFIFTFARVNGSSMEPTLHSNQVTLVSRLEYQFSEIKRGDIVITRYPSQVYPDIYIKRVIALSLETIEIKNGVVFVNGKEISEDYISAPCPVDMAPITVPEGCVFVMGDNRPDSADSRIVGVIPTNKIIGKAKFIVFPTLKNIED